MAISRWSPVSDLVSLHSAMDRLFNEALTPTRRGHGEQIDDVSEGYLPLDVYQTDKDWVIRAAVPSADPQQINVTCNGKTIRIEGEIKQPPPTESRSENYWMRENFYGHFMRQVTLPEGANCDQTKAEFRNGMLELRVPKTQPSKPEAKKIPVTVKADNGSSQTPGQPSTATQPARERELQSAGRK